MFLFKDSLSVIINDIFGHYHCHKLRFTYCNTFTLVFSFLTLENGLQKHVRKDAEIKYGFVKLVVIFKFFTGCDYVIPSMIKNHEDKDLL